MNADLTAKNLNDFRKKLFAKVSEYEKAFAEKIKADVPTNNTHASPWTKSLKKLASKHSFALKKILFSIFFFNKKRYRILQENVSLYTLKDPYELLQVCHESYVFKLKQVLENKQLENQPDNYVATKKEFSDEIIKIRDKTLQDLDSLYEKTACLVDCLPKKMITKTHLIQSKIKHKLNDYCASVSGKNIQHFMLSSKKVMDGKPYSLIKAKKRIEIYYKWIERSFWRYEIKKVNLLNKPHKNQIEMQNVPNDSLLLKNVYKFYSNNVYTYKVLNNINLEIKLGEFVVIFGSSGSGKTTLLNLISGMDRASAGYIYCAGTNLIKLSSNGLTKFRRKNVGYIFQQYGLLPNLTVRENVEVGSHLQKNYSKKIDINLLLNDVGMLNKKDSLPIELSGGQQQRVSIARAIAKHPLIIFADEPTAALDDATTKVIMDLFLNLNEKYKITFVVVSHNSLFGELADKVIHVNDGEIKSIVTKDSK